MDVHKACPLRLDEAESKREKLYKRSIPNHQSSFKVFQRGQAVDKGPLLSSTQLGGPCCDRCKCLQISEYPARLDRALEVLYLADIITSKKK